MSDMLEKALAGMRAALVQSPDNGVLWLQVAETLLGMERLTEAEDALREAARHLPEGADRTRAETLLAELHPIAKPDSDNVLQLRKKPRADPWHQPVTQAVKTDVTFASVGGLDEVKEDIRMRIILPFTRPDIFRAYGRKSGGGILMYGPPGCGKTLLAKATAGECKAGFYNVSIDDILDKWYGESERKLASVFEEARKNAPAVLFFDELEAIGANRQQIRNSPGKTLVNQLLSEMDGMEGKNEQVLIMAATNAPWYVDPALRRPGRFDRVLFVPPPDLPARLDILRIASRGRPIADGLDLSTIAKKTGDFSGADLHALVETAMDAPLKAALRTGEMRPVGDEDFRRSLAETRPTTTEWFATARNYATFANTGGLYDDLMKYMDGKK